MILTSLKMYCLTCPLSLAPIQVKGVSFFVCVVSWDGVAGVSFTNSSFGECGISWSGDCFLRGFIVADKQVLWVVFFLFD